jgi:probable HAF family extracellular repeat protein
MQGLGDLPGASNFDSHANGISADGSVIVGQGSSPSGSPRAFRWTSSGGMTDLGDLPGGTNFNWANAVSANGTTIVGLAHTATGPVEGDGFRWTAASGMVSLGEFPGGSNRIEPLAVSGDGSIIAGYVTTGIYSFASAFVWDAAHGLRDFKSVLLNDYGLTSVQSWNIAYVYSVSADGLTFVGMGSNPAGHQEAFIAQIPEPSTVLLLLVLSPVAFRKLHSRAARRTPTWPLRGW